MYYWCCHFCARWLNARAKTRRACVRILVYYTTLNVVLCIAELHYPTIKHVIPFAYICCCCRFCCHCWLLAAVVCSFYSPLPFMPIYNGRRKERKRKKKPNGTLLLEQWSMQRRRRTQQQRLHKKKTLCIKMLIWACWCVMCQCMCVCSIECGVWQRHSITMGNHW